MGNMRKQVKILLSVLILIYTFSTCSNKVVFAPPPVYDAADIVPALSESIHVNFYFDATPSMKGFINPGPSSCYLRTVKHLEGAATSCWKNCMKNFFKFGEEVFELKDREYLEIGSPNFYPKDEKYKKTCINTVLDTIQPDQFTVIVTDLFENNSDIELLIDKLKETCFGKGLTVGVVGITSEFDGTVYDVNGHDFKYASKKNDPVTFRPFYLLLIGSQPDIDGYYKALTSLDMSGSGTSSSFILFPLSFVKAISTFEGAKTEYLYQMAENSGIMTKPIDNRINELVRQFRINGSAKKPIFKVSLQYKPLSGQSGFKQNGIRVRVIPERLVRGVFSGDEGLNGVMELSNSTSEGYIKLDVGLKDPSRLAKGIYRFNIVLDLDKEEYKAPSWVQELDMDVGKLEEWIETPGSFDGSKTINLGRFINGLGDVSGYFSNSRIGHIYIYIRKV